MCKSWLVVFCVGILLVFTGCGDIPEIGGDVPDDRNESESYLYVCSNGSPADGRSTVSNEERCSGCDDGYHLSGIANNEDTVCIANTHTCTNGVAFSGRPLIDEQEGCSSCDAGYTVNAVDQCVMSGMPEDVMCSSNENCDTGFGRVIFNQSFQLKKELTYLS